METFLKYYRNSTIGLVLAVIIGGIIGFFQSNGSGIGVLIGAALTGAFNVLILSILELSMSFDNAVLNATELQTLPEKYKQWFVKWGILIAVVGMRFLFPVLIVSAVGLMTPWTAFTLALDNPSKYSEILASSHDYISAFGGAFLMMVALTFFLDKEKDNHWLKWLEAPLTHLAQLEVVLTLGVILLTSLEVPSARQYVYVLSGVLGVALFLAVAFLKDYLENHKPQTASVVGASVKAGIASLIYLEILDASMSFDGVIGAFAITTEIFIVMLGLGVGASYVRSMTLHLVEKNTMAEYRYLENGALWAIATLATIMFVKVNHDVPELFTGLVSAVIIACAVYHSHILNKKDALESSDKSTFVEYAEKEIAAEKSL